MNRAAYDEIIQKETDSYVGVYLHAVLGRTGNDEGDEGAH